MDDVLTAHSGFETLAVSETMLEGSSASSRRTALIKLALAYLLLALLLRGLTFGDPALHVDEQFYLLVGDRLLHGSLPYVDIWDRKPVGLFVLYAAIRALGGEGIVQYQVVAMLSASATALTINRIARNISSPRGAWWAGLSYLLYLSAFNCFGGQSPVYYNLLVALAAWAMCSIVTGPPGLNLVARGAGVMALIGLAIQIKYTVVFEGIMFGLTLLARARTDGFPPTRIAAAATVWIAVALIPTALAWSTYIYLGQGQAYYFANFRSIFSREESQTAALWRLIKEMAVLIPFWFAIFHAPERVKLPCENGSNEAARSFLRLWGTAAVFGFLIFGTWYDHYVAPLLGPLAVLAGPMLGRAGKFRIYTQLLIGFGLIAAAYMTIYETTRHGTRIQIAHASALISSHLGGGCAYLYEGDPILYLTTHSCLATRYIFPNHLAGAVDAKSLGVNANQEVTRIMASHPSVVMIGAKPVADSINIQSREIVLRSLAQDYTQYSTTIVGKHEYKLFELNLRSSIGTPSSETPHLRAGFILRGGSKLLI